MKSAMPYLGVSTVPLRKVCRDIFKALSWPDRVSWESDVLAIWHGAEFREERYAAIELTGAWWDYVDNIATQRLWAILQNDGQAMKERMLAWSSAADMWKRRSAILCQIKAKQETDLDFLYACIEPSLDSREFFLRKAIGWALRQYAWTDADEVRRYVAQHADRMSRLSRREARKNVGAVS